MTPTSALASLAAAGLAVSLPPGVSGEYRLMVSPRRAITPLHRALIAEHRGAIVDLLYGRSMESHWPAVAETPAIRWACSPWPGDGGTSPGAARNEELALE